MKPITREFETLYAHPLIAERADEEVMTFTYNGHCLAMDDVAARELACWILDVTMPKPELPPRLVLTEKDHAAIVRKSKDRARAGRASRLRQIEMGHMRLLAAIAVAA